MWIRRGLGGALIASGVLWSVLFPKKASLDHDMVASVCIGLGLLGSGALFLAWPRMRRATGVLSLLLLWSVLGNVYWIAWSEDAEDALLPLLRTMEIEGGAGRPTGLPEALGAGSTAQPDGR